MKITPFDEFIAETEAAAFADFQGDPATKVADSEEFEAMKNHILTLYADSTVIKTILVDNKHFDCIAVGEVSDDAEGCPEGTIPMRRVTLNEMTRFRRLKDFLGKGPGGKSPG